MFVRAIRKNEMPLDGAEAYLNQIPAISTLETLTLEKPVSYFIGENGAGKSTLLEAVAAAFGFNPEGGTRNFNFSTSRTHSGLFRYISLVKNPRPPKDGYFLRAESFYNAASYIDSIDEDGLLSLSYGGKSLHAQSHGESFLSLALNRFGANGFYILDEPEAALSPMRQLSLLCRIHDLAENGSQFLIATHSPILMAYPDADIFLLDESGMRKTEYEQTEHYQITKRFLADPRSMLKTLFEDE